MKSLLDVLLREFAELINMNERIARNEMSR